MISDQKNYRGTIKQLLGISLKSKRIIGNRKQCEYSIISHEKGINYEIVKERSLTRDQIKDEKIRDMIPEGCMKIEVFYGKIDSLNLNEEID